jgi:FHA domain
MSSLRLRILAGGRGSSPHASFARNDGAGADGGPDRDQVRDWKENAPREVRIGRHPDNELELPYAGISALHARLFQRGDGQGVADGEWWLEDLGSSNGTWVGNTRLRPGVPHLVDLGAAFRLGGLSIQLEPLPSRAGALESTATMGRRLIVDGLAPHPVVAPRSGPTSTTSRPLPERPVRPATARPPAGPSESIRRGAITPPSIPPPLAWSTRKGIVIGFAIGMTVLAVSGLVALALSLR